MFVKFTGLSIIMLLAALFIFCFQKTHILMLLISIEMMILGFVFMSTFPLQLPQLEILLVFLLIIGAMGASIGLSCLSSTSRSKSFFSENTWWNF